MAPGLRLPMGLCAFLTLMAPPAGVAHAAPVRPVLSAKVSEPLLVVVLTPQRAANRPAIDRLLGFLAQALERDTDLEPEEVPVSEAMLACGVRLSCLVPAAVDEGDRSSRRSTERSGLRYVLVFSLLGAEGQPLRLGAVLLDGAAVTAIVRREQKAGSGGVDPELLEERLSQDTRGAVLARPASVLARSSEEMRAWVERLVSTDFHPTFDRAGNWLPFGAVELHLEEGDGTVFYDGRPLGLTQDGTARIAFARAGQHAVRVEAPGGRTVEANVEVRAQQVATLEVELSSPSSGSWPSASLWTGLGVSAIGVGLGVYGLVASGAAGRSGYTAVCVAPAEGPGCGAGSEFLRLGAHTPNDSPVTGADPDPNGSGPMILPLGYSLILGGAAIAVASWLLDDDPKLWWVPLLTGLGAGIAAYGLSAALDGSNGLPSR